MKLFRSWPLYAVLAVFIGYLVFSGDETPKEGTEPSTEAKSSTAFPRGMNTEPSGWDNQARSLAPSAPLSGYQAYPGSGIPVDPAQSNLYRFRPVEQAQDSQDRYPPSYTFSDRQGVYGPMSGQQRDDPMAQQYPMPGQEDMNYRFRPLDQSRQSRRWSGNYPNPYTQRNYYAPENRPGQTVGGDSLWAESAPKR